VRRGILGGTFNPIHLGHLRGAEEARERLHLDQICFVPAAIPPHKNERIEVSASHRLEIVRLAIKDNPAFSVSDVELRREGKSYSVETLRFFCHEDPEAELFFIVGLDSFLEITTWKKYHDIFALCHVVVLSRPGVARCDPTELTPREFWRAFHPGRNSNHWIYMPSGHSVYFLDRPFMDISSSEIRQRIRRGKSIRYMMPERVEAYVLQKRCYSGEMSEDRRQETGTRDK
jgi:nicotinate-nucleotide adenylyltransferase